MKRVRCCLAYPSHISKAKLQRYVRIFLPHCKLQQETKMRTVKLRDFAAQAHPYRLEGCSYRGGWHHAVAARVRKFYSHYPVEQITHITNPSK